MIFQITEQVLANTEAQVVFYGGKGPRDADRQLIIISFDQMDMRQVQIHAGPLFVQPTG